VRSTRGVVLDAGAFIAVERRDRVMTELARRFAKDETPLVTSAGVVAQVWRGGPRAQVPIAFLLRRTTVVDLTQPVAKVIGRMLGATRTKDPIDAHVVLLARERGWIVLSSDPDDLRRIDPTLVIETI
jgi:predicted nucleic acid-binding protein